jgi:antitoxin component YwqK of YwqJK toxin-antitoxin module
MLRLLRLPLVSLLALSLWHCQPASTAAAPVTVTTIDESEYELFEVATGDSQRAELRGPEGQLAETGYVRNGLKQGTWTSYNPEGEVPIKIVSYIDGMLNGPYVELDDLGRLAVVATYKDNQLHGHYGKYRIGRPELTINYTDGQMDGVFAEYDYAKNKLRKEAYYKMGKMDGPLRHYNEDGKIILEYLYKDDVKVSGGMVE